MSECSDRFTIVADGFSRRVDAVRPADWDNPSPCDGWVARDVVRHLVEWVPAFFGATVGLEFPAGPSVDDDPAGAWTALRGTIDGFFADPAIAAREVEGPMGRMPVEQALDMIVTGDVLVHTWDLARATGLDETLDPVEVHRMYEGTEGLDEVLRSSGHYGPRVIVPGDADEQTKLLAFMGRDPSPDR
ncbi:MAG: TIGR03086 family metal-binding protein [Acidimicrobiia bacterium]